MVQKRRGGEGSASAKAQRWAGLCLLALAFFSLAALLTFDPLAYGGAHQRGEALFPFAGKLVAYASQAPVVRGPAAGLYGNAGGGLGLLVAALLVRGWGWIAVWFWPAAFLAWGWNRLLRRPVRSLLWKSVVALPLAVSVAGVTASLVRSRAWSGGVGQGLWHTVHALVGPAGGLLVLGVAAAGLGLLEAEAWDGRRGALTRAILAGCRRVLALLGRGVLAGLRALRQAVWATLRWIRTRPWEGGVSLNAVEPPEEGSGPARAAGARGPVETEWTPPRIVNPDVEERMPARPEPAPAPAAAKQPGTPPEPAARPVPVAATAGPAHYVARGTPAPAPAAAAAPGAGAPVVRRIPTPADPRFHDVEDAVMEARLRARPGKVEPTRRRRGPVTLPTLDILDDVPETGPPVAESELTENSKILTQTLMDFGITGKVGEVHPGPVITRYEYIPGPGVRVSQILNRQDDLALKLRASRIRILAPIPGKAAVGIEVPNRKPAPIFLRRLLETRAFQSAGGPLPLALGKDIGGAPVMTELSRMPHLLIAGTTGSGKSVCMNALITSLLMKRNPNELRMLMVDPKMLELPMYDGIPHLLTKVVTDPKVAVRSLRWALLEMEQRYRTLAARGCRNLASYNSKMDSEGPLKEGEEKLPYIVIFIDELADLMMTGGREVEEPIARLAQLARAVGIHLIVATQRPSVDVITGVIKANFPCRVAFQVASKTDSRTILDQNGAESLLGKGDMLFLPPGQAAPLRVHGAFVSEEETQRLAKAWRDQGEPEACPGLEEVLAEPEAAAGGIGEDALFEEAARLVVGSGQASASMLQRRLKVGYARAARLVDMLEAAGVVSPQDGSKARDVLVDEVRLEHVLAGMDG